MSEELNATPETETAESPTEQPATQAEGDAFDYNAPEAAPTMKKNLSFEDKVVKKIVGIATAGIDGVVPLSGGLINSFTDRFLGGGKTRGISAEVGSTQVAVDLNVACEYGRSIPELFEAVSAQVGDAVFSMTGLHVAELNMHVADVLSEEDFAALVERTKSESAKRNQQLEPLPAEDPVEDPAEADEATAEQEADSTADEPPQDAEA